MRDLHAVQKVPMPLPEESANEPDTAVGKISFSAGIWVVFVI